MTKAFSRVPPAFLFPVAFFAAWQLLVGRVDNDMLPKPVPVLRFMWNEVRGDTVARATVYEQFGITLSRLAIGIAGAMLAGVIIGILAGLSKHFDAFTRDFVIAAMGTPGLIFSLIAAMWFGFKYGTPLVALLLTCTPFAIVNVAEGVRNVPLDLLDMSRAFNVSRRSVMWNITVPSLLPFVFVSLRMVISLGWKTLAIAEIFASDSGAGWMLRYWWDAARVNGLVGYSFFFVIVTVIIDRLILKRLSNWAFRWRSAQKLLAKPGGAASAV